MNEARRAAIFAVLEQARVAMSPDQQGPELLLEKLRECRRWQDTVITLSAEVMQARAGARKALRGYKAMQQLGQDVRDQVRDAEDLLDDLRALEESTRLCRSNLKGTDSDIRLSAQLLDQQIRLGQIQPPPPAPPSLHATGVPLGIETFFTTGPAAPLPSTVPPGPHAPPASGVVTAEWVDITAFFKQPSPK